jgi:hypothetical protein
MRQSALGLAGRAPVVREDPAELLRVLAREALDVSSEVGVACRALGSRERRVRDVADQSVPEAVLDVALETALLLAADEIALRELVERLGDVDAGRERLDEVPPERPPDHRRGEEDGAERRGEGVDAGGDRGGDRHGQPGVGDAVCEAGRKLLDEQRVALRDVDDAVHRVIRPGADEGRRELTRLLRAQRLERDARVRGEPRAPRLRVEELGPREHDDHGRRVAHLRAEVLEQLELARCRPVDVLVDDERRPLVAEALDHAA